MEKTTRTIEVTFEKREFLVVRHRRSVSAWCDRCGKATQLMPPEKIISAAPRQIYQWIERGTVYFAELPDGLLLACADCVSRKIG